MEPRASIADRSLFPALRARAYLAHAAVSPPSSVVQAAVAESLQGYAERGLQSAIEQLRRRVEVRALAARLLGCEPDQVGFVQSTSAGVVTVARSIPFVAGDRIVVFEGEFPANVAPWRLCAQERELELITLPLAPFARSHAEGLELVRRELTRGVRLVAVSAVQFQTGLAMPLGALAALCHEFGAELFVDAIQALGVMPLDVRALDLDYLVAGGHKFLMGLEGLGVLYIADRALRGLSLGMAGWTGVEDAFHFLTEPNQLRYDRPVLRRASFVEQGALSVVGIAALGASLELLLALGVDAIFAHVTRYLDALEPQLEALGYESVRAREVAARSASLCLHLPPGKTLSQVAQSLAAQGVIASTPDGHLRFAPHYPNSLNELPLVVEAARRALET